MWKSAMQERWSHTAAVQAIIYNVNRGKNSPAKKPEDFNPVLLHQKYGGLADNQPDLQNVPRSKHPLEP